MKALVIRPRAEADIDDCAEYIAQESVDAAVRFLAATQQTFELLCDMPEIGTAWESNNPRLQDIRRYAIKGFHNYLIFYRVTADSLEILRLLHGARSVPKVLEDEFGSAE